jgi:hypothetical protein
LGQGVGFDEAMGKNRCIVALQHLVSGGTGT